MRRGAGRVMAFNKKARVVVDKGFAKAVRILTAHGAEVTRAHGRTYRAHGTANRAQRTVHSQRPTANGQQRTANSRVFANFLFF